MSNKKDPPLRRLVKISRGKEVSKAKILKLWGV